MEAHADNSQAEMLLKQASDLRAGESGKASDCMMHHAGRTAVMEALETRAEEKEHRGADYFLRSIPISETFLDRSRFTYIGVFGELCSQDDIRRAAELIDFTRGFDLAEDEAEGVGSASDGKKWLTPEEYDAVCAQYDEAMDSDF